jgi:hypothetical protein
MEKNIHVCLDKWPDSGKEMAVIPELLWKNRRIRVRFLNGEPSVKKRVENIAKEWENHANLILDFVDDEDSEIRIGFKWKNEIGIPDESSWSYVGTMAVTLTEDGTINKDNPTMHYGWLEPSTQEIEYRRVVLHEFGHALGCIHEHQSPAGGIPWDVPKVYEFYKKTQGWDKKEVDQQVLGRYSETITNFTEFDPKSIMEYPVDNALTIGDFEIGLNTELSGNDKKFMTKTYPPDATT